jgi:hypothetical protein
MNEYLEALEELRKKIIDSQIIAIQAKSQLEKLMNKIAEANMNIGVDEDIKTEANRLTQHND